MKKSLFWKSNEGSRLKIIKKCKIFISAIIAISISYYLTSGICTAEVLPKPCYENRFYICPVSDKFNHAGGINEDSSLATMFADNFGAGPCGPYAKSGAQDGCYFMTELPPDLYETDLDNYEYIGWYLENTLKTCAETNCPVEFQMNGNVWGHSHNAIGSLGYWLKFNNNEWVSDRWPGWSFGLDPYHNISRYNTVFRIYYRRNVTAVIHRMLTWAKEYPHLFIDLVDGSETEFATSISKTLPALEYEDWRNNTGIYDSNNLTLNLWWHPDQTGVTDVVFDPDGAAVSLSTSQYEYRGQANLYGLILISYPSAADNDVVEYEVIGGEDEGKRFKSRLDDYRGTGRKGPDSVDDFYYAQTDHMCEDEIKWMYYEFRKFGYSHEQARMHLYFHNPNSTRHDCPASDDPEGNFTTNTTGTYGSGAAHGCVNAGATVKSQQSPWLNWGAAELSYIGNPGSCGALYSSVEQGAHQIAPYHWPGYAGSCGTYYAESGQADFQTIINRLGWSPYKQGQNNYNGGNYNDADIYDPPELQNVVASRTGPTSAEINWENRIWEDIENSEWNNWPQFNYFKIYRSTAIGITGSLVTTTTDYSLNDNSILSGNTYYYTVSAVNTSATEGAKIQVPAYEVTISTPSLVQATDGTGLVSITTTIEHPLENECRIKVEYFLDNGKNWQGPPYLDPVYGVSTSYGTALLDNTTTYQVYSIDTSGGPNTVVFKWDTKTGLNEGGSLDNNEYRDVKVRITLNDNIFNYGAKESSSTIVDNLAPVVDIPTDLASQAQAGEDTSIRLKASFIETSPSTSQFYVAINSGSYDAGTPGDSNIVNPQCEVNMLLDGDDSIYRVKCILTDKYGNTCINENLSPAPSFKDVQPYTPPEPNVTEATVNSVDIRIKKNFDEVTGLEYCIYESNKTSQYVQEDGSLNTSPVWKTISDWGEEGKVTVTGLVSPLDDYYFQVKSRNKNNNLVESDYSSAVHIGISRHWLETTDTHFNAGILNNVLVQGTGESAYIKFSGFKPPSLSNGFGGIWQYRREIAINNSVSPLTDYQVMVTLTPNTFDYPKVQSGGEDIRFTGSDGITELNYWCEEWNLDGNSKLWVKVPSISTSPVTVIYIYYGNSSAASSSDIENTYLFYDNFDDLTKWSTKTGSPVVDGAEGMPAPSVRLTGTVCGSNTNTWIYTNTDLAQDVLIEADVKGQTNAILDLTFRLDPANSYSYIAQLDPRTGFLTGDQYNDRFFKQTGPTTWTKIGNNLAHCIFPNQWYRLKVAAYQNNFALYLDGAMVAWLEDVSYNYLRLGMFNQCGEFYVDNLRVRKYSSPEPTIQIAIEEESMYSTSAEFISSTFYNQNLVGDVIKWTEDLSGAGTDIQIQIATKKNIEDPWNFVGQDGTGSSYYTESSSQTIWSGHAGDYYFKYKIYFIDDDGEDTPILQSVNLEYTGDLTSPSAITNLSALTGVAKSEVRLIWTAPGDDGTIGDNYTGAFYTIKYATYSVAIGTQTWWDNATELNQSWQVSERGKTEEHVIKGLELGVTYYLAIRTTDDVGNQSDIDDNAKSETTQAWAMANDQNARPTITNPVSFQLTDESGFVSITAQINDSEGEACKLMIEYSLDGGTGWNNGDPYMDSIDNAAYGSPLLDNTTTYQVYNIITSSGANTITLLWDTKSTENGTGSLDNTEQTDVKLRVTANDEIIDGDVAISAASFNIDNICPVILTGCDLVQMPQAGKTTVLLDAGFTETNPDKNIFYVGINGGEYYSIGTYGESDISDPSAQATDAGVFLDGDDYISKVKCIHIDKYGNNTESENLSPNSGYKYIKPYAPAPPIVDNITINSADITVKKHPAEAEGLEYCIYESSKTGNYVQADGSLGISPVWQTIPNWGASGKITVTGLVYPLADYYFKTKTRNPNDISVESDYSPGKSASNYWTQETDEDFNAGECLSTTVIGLGESAYVRLVSSAGAGYGGFSNPDGGDWTFKKPVTITNSTTTLYNYQIFVATSDIDAGILIIEDKVQNDYDDIRFADINDTELKYCIDPDTNNTKGFWVKVSTIPAGDSTIYVYYGNPSASSSSNEEGVFDLYDDFNDSTVGSVWSSTIRDYCHENSGTFATNTDLSASESDNPGYFTISGSGGVNTATEDGLLSGWFGKAVRSSKSFDIQNNKYKIESEVNLVSYSFGGTGDHGIRFGLGFEQDKDNRIDLDFLDADTIGTFFDRGVNYSEEISDIKQYGNLSLKTMSAKIYQLKLVHTSNDASLWVDEDVGTVAGTFKSPTAYACIFAVVRNIGDSIDVRFNWIRVRRYLTSEPTVAAGTEESAGYVLSGTFISSVFHTTDITEWDSIHWTEDLSGAGTDLRFQMATSTSANPSDFKGPDGSTSTYYTTPTGEAAWSGHGDDDYIKYKAFLLDDDGKNSPKLRDITIIYTSNIPSEAPLLSSPTDGSTVIGNKPTLTWDVPSDINGDELHFKVEISTDPGFSVYAGGTPSESKDSAIGFSPVPPVSEGSGQCKYTLQSSLEEMTYFWKVSAWDGICYGYASGIWKFNIMLDPAPPSAITDLTAQTGGTIGRVRFIWTAPGDDGTAEDNAAGSYYTVKYATYSVVVGTDTWWSNAEEFIQSWAVSNRGSLEEHTITGLEAGTTYYFAIKTTDDANNQSGIDEGALSESTQAKARAAETGSVPTASNPSANQGTDGTGLVSISTIINDADGDVCKLKVEYSLDGGTSWTDGDPYIDTSYGVPATHGNPALNNDNTYQLYNIITSSGANTITFKWDIKSALNGTGSLDNDEYNNVKIRILPHDGLNLGDVKQSAVFIIDNLAPSVLATSDLVSKPSAGDTTVLITASFTESNPDKNIFYAAINGGSYGSGTTGESNTVSPSAQGTNAGATLHGDDWISKVKCEHTDDYGNVCVNENTNPSNRYVKPYTPETPLVTNPTTNTVDVTVRKNINETPGLNYCIYEGSKTSQYVQADGSLGSGLIYKTISNWGTSGKITVTGLSIPLSDYYFQTKSMNPNDITTESEYSLASYAEGIEYRLVRFFQFRRRDLGLQASFDYQ